MRFGVTENLYGIDEIAAFRKGRSPVNLARTIRRLDIVTFGRDYREHHAGIRAERGCTGTVSGRQSQVWVRLPGGLADCVGACVAVTVISLACLPSVRADGN